MPAKKPEKKPRQRPGPKTSTKARRVAAAAIVGVISPPAESGPRAGRPVPPIGLSDPARAQWDQICGELESLGTLCTVDRMSLELYIDAWERFQRAKADVADNGFVIETGMGGLKGNPAATHLSKAWAQLARMLDVLGLSPTTRGRGKPADQSDAKTADRLDSFKARHAKRQA